MERDAGRAVGLASTQRALAAKPPWMRRCVKRLRDAFGHLQMAGWPNVRSPISLQFLLLTELSRRESRIGERCTAIVFLRLYATNHFTCYGDAA